MKRTIKFLGTFLLFIAVLWLTGCATARGAGEDLESAGKTIQGWTQ